MRDAERAQRMQRARSPGRLLLEQHASVISSSRRCGGETGRRCSASLDRREHAADAELQRRQVDRELDVRRASASRRRRRAAARSRRAASIRPVSSATGMNSDGGIRPRSGCGQRSSASKPMISPVAEIDQRLVVDLELAVRRAPCAGRSRAGGAPAPGRPSPARRSGSALAVGLGAVERHVGVLQQVVGDRRRRRARRRCRCWRRSGPCWPSIT